MAAPSFALDRHGDSQEGAQVGHGAIEFLKIYIEGLALGAAGLFVESHAVYVHALEDGLIKQSLRIFGVIGIDAEFHATDEVGNEPVEAHQVVISQEAL